MANRDAIPTVLLELSEQAVVYVEDALTDSVSPGVIDARESNELLHILETDVLYSRANNSAHDLVQKAARSHDPRVIRDALGRHTANLAALEY